jgi:phosphinothricin acetyltransferase
MTSLIIRDALESDIEAIQAIYAYYVENTVITFEEVVPDTMEMTRRFEGIKSHDMPYLVAELDGEVVGYAYAGVFRTRKAFRFSTEHSIYLKHDCRGQGLGRKMMDALISALEPTGIRQIVAVISDKIDGASVALHKKCGFDHIGIMPDTGYKFDEWIDTVIMQRAINGGGDTPPAGPGLHLD